MSEDRYRARAMELGIKVEALTQVNVQLNTTVAMLENNLEAQEEACVAMERDRDEQLEIVNRHGTEPIGDLEFQIRLLKLRIESKEDDFEHLDVLCDGYKAQRDAARAELNGETVVDLTGEETLRPTAAETGPNFEPVAEDVVPFHKEGGRLVADKPVITLPDLRPEELTHIADLNADFRQAIEERDDARRDLAAYMVRTTVLEEALARTDADLKNFREGVAGGDTDSVASLKQEIDDLEAGRRENLTEISDLVSVIADNAEKENRAAEVITNLRGQIADLTIERDRATFDRDRLTETAAENATARKAEGNLAARVIMDLRGQVQNLIVQQKALTTDPSRLGDLEKQLDETQRARDLAQLDRHNLTEKLKVTDAKVAAFREKIEFIGEAGFTTQQHLEEAERRVDELIGETDTLTAALELAEEKMTEETKKNATLRKNLHQAIKHIDAMTNALMDRKDCPESPACLSSGEEETNAEVRMMLAKYRTEFVRLAKSHLELEKQVRDLQAKLDPACLPAGGAQPAPSVPFTGLSRAEVAERPIPRTRVMDIVRSVYARAKSRHVRGGSECRDGCPICVGLAMPCDEINEAVEAAAREATPAKPPAQVVQVAAASMFGSPESPADDDDSANASACIQVWLAPTTPCPATKDGSHSFASPTARHGHADITPYCPQCHESFTKGPTPDPDLEPNVEYVVPKEARRMTGS